MNEKRRAPRGLVSVTWVVALVVFVATLTQVVVWAMIWWIGGEMITPFWAWTLAGGGVVVLALVSATFVAGRLPDSTRTSRDRQLSAPSSEDLL